MMKKKSTIIIDIPPKPRIKEEYQEMKDIKPITFYLGNDFRAELKNNIIIHLDRLDDTTLPLAGNFSIILDLYTDRNLSSIGVLKNVLDACNGLLFSDDKKSESVLVRVHPCGGKNESLHLKLLSGRSIISASADNNTLDPYVIFSMNISTVLEDRYLTYPLNSGMHRTADLNKEYDDSLVKILRESYVDDTLLGIIGISLNINVNDSKCDIDNIAMNYLKNSTGILYEHISQIKMLLINKKISDKQEEHCKISLYEM